jgi:hypothetical protein
MVTQFHINPMIRPAPKREQEEAKHKHGRRTLLHQMKRKKGIHYTPKLQQQEQRRIE